ncbi:hypothetical protein, partial [Streptomyces fuscigenes]|uniref:hypothetical protein n=1 Tax=Streptomyces fuscigenes TaxID=1528880 RepID=UPI001F2E0CFA
MRSPAPRPAATTEPGASRAGRVPPPGPDATALAVAVHAWAVRAPHAEAVADGEHLLDHRRLDAAA